MTQTWATPSGSRWEPVPTDADALDGDRTAARIEGGDRPGRRRQPVLVALVALLSLGAAGGAAYELSSRVPAPSAGAAVGQRATPDGGGAGREGRQLGGPDGRDGRHRHGASTDGQDGARAGASS